MMEHFDVCDRPVVTGLRTRATLGGLIRLHIVSVNPNHGSASDVLPSTKHEGLFRGLESIVKADLV